VLSSYSCQQVSPRVKELCKYSCLRAGKIGFTHPAFFYQRGTQGGMYNGGLKDRLGRQAREDKSYFNHYEQSPAVKKKRGPLRHQVNIYCEMSGIVD